MCQYRPVLAWWLSWALSQNYRSLRTPANDGSISNWQILSLFWHWLRSFWCFEVSSTFMTVESELLTKGWIMASLCIISKKLDRRRYLDVGCYVGNGRNYYLCTSKHPSTSLQCCVHYHGYTQTGDRSWVSQFPLKHRNDVVSLILTYVP